MSKGEDRRRTFDLEDRLIDCSVRVLDVVEALPNSRAGNHIAGQLVRCGTAPAANYAEAQAAESRNDFIHKLAIVLKEVRETRCWLRMIVKGEMLPEQRLEQVLDEVDQLRKIDPLLARPGAARVDETAVGLLRERGDISGTGAQRPLHGLIEI